jgi:hypothetical protein
VLCVREAGRAANVSELYPLHLSWVWIICAVRMRDDGERGQVEASGLLLVRGLMQDADLLGLGRPQICNTSRVQLGNMRDGLTRLGKPGNSSKP